MSFPVFGRKHKDRATPVTADDEGIRRDLGDGRVEQVRWAELAEIRVVSTVEGPFSEDVFFVLVDRAGTGCVVPLALADENLMQRLQGRPGFDHDALAAAISQPGSTNRRLWRAGAPGPD
jgi:hypothetical protein